MSDKKILCWHCGKPLSLKKGLTPIFAEYVDPIGNKHKLHKICLEAGEYESKPVTARPRQEAK